MEISWELIDPGTVEVGNLSPLFIYKVVAPSQVVSRISEPSTVVTNGVITIIIGRK